MLCKLKLMTILVCLVAFVLPASIAAQSQTTKQEQHAAEIRSKTKQFGPSDKVTVKLDDGTSYSGTVRSANDNDFVVLDGSGTPRTIRYADVHSIGKHGGGPKIGIVIALAAVGTAAIIFAIFKASGKRL
jgi:small nuclear ribonucleoprotein (snRNP)-like protein